jgi:superfamily II helicase
MGDKFLNVSAFRQMCGRAGRMGLDAKVRTVGAAARSCVQKSIC